LKSNADMLAMDVRRCRSGRCDAYPKLAKRDYDGPASNAIVDLHRDLEVKVQKDLLQVTVRYLKRRQAAQYPHPRHAPKIGGQSPRGDDWRDYVTRVLHEGRPLRRILDFVRFHQVQAQVKIID